MVLQALNPKNARVMIVEDSPDDQEIVNRALRTYGIRHSHTARTAEEALRQISRQTYDVAFIDYNLPGMNGLQLLEALRRVAPDMRVVVVTGARQEAVAVSALKLGAADYISKDEFLTSGIVRSLQSVLRKRIEEEDTEQRETLTSGQRELHEASIEGAWLLQALDERHGYMPLGKGARDPLGEDEASIVADFASYLRTSRRTFPQPATEQEDQLLRVIIERGVSPRELFRIYIAAVRQLLNEGDGGASDAVAVRPVLFLTHAMACMVEEYQTLLSLDALNRAS